MFQINATGQWAKVGADIDGEAAYDLSGSSVSLSADSGIVAVSVRCCQLDLHAWIDEPWCGPWGVDHRRAAMPSPGSQRLN